MTRSYSQNISHRSSCARIFSVQSWHLNGMGSEIKQNNAISNSVTKWIRNNYNFVLWVFIMLNLWFLSVVEQIRQKKLIWPKCALAFHKQCTPLISGLFPALNSTYMSQKVCGTLYFAYEQTAPPFENVWFILCWNDFVDSDRHLEPMDISQSWGSSSVVQWQAFTAVLWETSCEF